MSVKNVELYTCDDCKTLILIGKGGVHFSSVSERITAKWAGGFQEHGNVTKGHAPPAFPAPKGLTTGPFDGLDAGSARSVTLCRKCLAKRFGFKDDSDLPEERPDGDAPTRFNHNEPV